MLQSVHTKSVSGKHVTSLTGYAHINNAPIQRGSLECRHNTFWVVLNMRDPSPKIRCCRGSNVSLSTPVQQTRNEVIPISPMAAARVSYNIY